jgi:PIN domain nuclease of toxin-antitoxin system
MRLLLDTHILIALIEERVGDLGRRQRDALLAAEHALHASVVSLWEIAIKVRLGKLALRVELAALPELLRGLHLHLLAIEASHVLALVAPEPATRDPFDLLLLAQCAVEGLRLVTLDRMLSAHPLAWKPVSGS